MTSMHHGRSIELKQLSSGGVSGLTTRTYERDTSCGKSSRVNIGWLAQLTRAPRWHRGGRWFESSIALFVRPWCTVLRTDLGDAVFSWAEFLSEASMGRNSKPNPSTEKVSVPATSVTLFPVWEATATAWARGIPGSTHAPLGLVQSFRANHLQMPTRHRTRWTC